MPKMARHPRNKNRAPLSQYTTEALRATSAELRNTATNTRTAADKQALDTLAGRFDILADQRNTKEHPTHTVSEEFTPPWVRAGIVAKGHAGAFMLGRTMGMPSPDAFVMATEAMGRHLVMPEAPQHPTVQYEAMKLAYLVAAYGLTAPQPTSDRPCIAETPSEAAIAQQSILVVDDVADVLVTVGAFLSKAGFDVQKAADGDEALRMIAIDPQIRILVTDFAMPGLSGADLIAQAMEVRPNLKSLVITGYPNADGLAELPPHTSILVKPFRRDALIAGVQSLLGRMRPIPNETEELIEYTKP
jgi:CheY-like chemotaxis protein